MKKIFLLLGLLPSIAFAQINIYENGSVLMGNQSSNAVKVKVGIVAISPLNHCE